MHATHYGTGKPSWKLLRLKNPLVAKYEAKIPQACFSTFQSPMEIEEAFVVWTSIFVRLSSSRSFEILCVRLARIYFSKTASSRKIEENIKAFWGDPEQNGEF